MQREQALSGKTLESLERAALFALKRAGFSDWRLAKLLNTSAQKVRSRRWALDVRPVYKRVDTCAAEFDTHTAYPMLMLFRSRQPGQSWLTALALVTEAAAETIAIVPGADTREPARLASPLPANGVREDFMRAAIHRADDGIWLATALPDQDSSLVKMLARAEALIVRAPDAPAAAVGEACRIIKLEGMGA